MKAGKWAAIERDRDRGTGGRLGQEPVYVRNLDFELNRLYHNNDATDKFRTTTPIVSAIGKQSHFLPEPGP